MIYLSAPVPVIEFDLASRGVSKGLSQTKGPQFVARAEVSTGPLYVGGYWKNVTATTSGEAGATVGVRTKIGGFNVGASAALKIASFPAPGTNDKALEVAGTVSRKIGRLTPQLAVVWSPHDLGTTRRSTFVEASAAYTLSSTTTLSAAFGRRDRVEGADYTAFNAGITQRLTKNFTADLRYYGTDKRHLGYTYQPGLTASLRAHF